jgi:hypothetical protein
MKRYLPLLCALLAACSTTAPTQPAPVVIDSACTWDSKLTANPDPVKGDTIPTIKEIVKHNRDFAERCPAK